MKIIKKVLKWVVLPLLILVLLILIPIGVHSIYQNIRASFLSNQEKHMEDLDRLSYLFENEFGGYEALSTKADFYQQLNDLKQKVQSNEDLTDQDFKMEVIKTIAAFKDPHTGVYNALDHRFPYYLEWSDGYFYLLSGQVEKQWLGAKVLKIGNLSSQEAFDKLSSYTNSPNEAGTAYFMRNFIRYTAPLIHEGIINDQQSITLEVSLNGKSESLRFNSLSTEAYQKLTNYNRISQTVDANAIPLVNQNSEQNYWYKYNNADSLFYLRYSLCVDQGNVESFWDEVFEQLNELQPKKFVIDVRGNPGGDTQTHITFLNRLSQDTVINSYGKLFTLIDRGTGSAAVHFASDMERLTESILAGEKTIDTPNTTSDPTFFSLPHSQIKILLPKIYHFNSHMHDKRDAIIPDLPIVQKLEGKDYFVDQVLDSIRNLSFTAKQNVNAELPQNVAGQYSFSPIRNLQIHQQEKRWYITIDGIGSAPIYQKDSLFYTDLYDIQLNFNDAGSQLRLNVHESSLALTKISGDKNSIEKLMEEGKYEQAKVKIAELSQEGELPFYIERPYFQSKTYIVYHEQGLEKALALNALNKHFHPYDPVASLVNFELYQYDGQTGRQILSLFPVVGKVLHRYYKVVTTHIVMNDDYNPFIGS